MSADQSERPSSSIQLQREDLLLPALEERGDQIFGFADPKEMRDMARLLRMQDDTPQLSRPALELIVQNVRSELQQAGWLTEEEPPG
jgi:hypothetical protein